MLVKNKSLGIRTPKRRSQAVTNNIMKKENIINFVIGLLVGAMFVVFFQFNARLNNNALIISQLDQAVAANTQNLNDVISFLNSSAQQAAGTETPATPAQ
nr:MAG: hypothetical protein JST_1810 [Candidatus Parcubacteria bacterium]